MIRVRLLPFAVMAAVTAATLTVPTPSVAQVPAAASPFERLRFRNIGPATMSGRIDDFAVLESNPAVFYVATATGGLWKTTNGGTTWEVLFTDQPVVSIGDIAIPPNDANVVWVGTGENNNRQSGSWGNGIYKSTDGGRTFRHMGLAETYHIARVVVDPVDHDVVYVAALGNLWAPNRERGVFKTTDGGLTWTPILQGDQYTGATELVMDPSNNKILYAATYQRQRAAWGFNGGGPGSAIWKSTDAGRTWTRLTNGIPEGDLGRIGMDIYRKNPSVLYAQIQHATESGLYRSDDAGATWRKMSDLNPRPMYFSQVRIDPNDDHRIYVLGVELHISDDGGRTFVGNTVPHSDHHAMWINPANSNHVITGCDGGVNISWDRGRTWDFIDNMDLGQFYHVSFDMDVPYRVYGGLQDNASWYGPSAVRAEIGIGNFDWHNIGSGDGFVTLADPTDSRILYAESQGGNMIRVNRESQERKNIRPQPARGEPPYRWNWDTPMQLSPHDPATLYVAANRVFRSIDRGDTWQAISPDLTAQIDRDTLSMMGIPGADFGIARHDGVSAFSTITTFAESARRRGVIWTGSDDGQVYVTRDGGANWTTVSARIAGAPRFGWVSRVAPSAHDDGTAYVTYDNHRAGDFKPYVFVTTNFGTSWRSITTGIPDGHAVRTITEDLRNPNVLYVGTEFGLFVSLDKGARWMRVRANLPTVPINEIVIHPRENDLILATHGRSIWILDDLTPFQEAPAALATAAYLFGTRTAAQYNPGPFRPPFAGPGDRRFWGKNPEPGAALAYYLNAPAREVALRIHNGTGSVLRELSPEENEGREPGVHRIQWDLRYAPVPDSLLPPGVGGRGGRAPFVLPGDYQMTLVVNGRVVNTRSLRVDGDRLSPISDQDRRLWHDVSLALHRLQHVAGEAAMRVAELSDQLRTVQSLVRQAANPSAALREWVGTLDRQLASLRRSLAVPAPGEPAPSGRGGGPGSVRPVPFQLATVKGQLLASTSKPTAVQLRLAREARDDLAAAITAINRIIGTDMPAVYQALGQPQLMPEMTPLAPLPNDLP